MHELGGRFAKCIQLGKTFLFIKHAPETAWVFVLLSGPPIFAKVFHGPMVFFAIELPLADQ